MRIHTKKRLREASVEFSDAAREIMDLYTEILQAQWETPADVKASDPSADYVGGDRWVFNIRRNRYRLVVQIIFEIKLVRVRFIGTHADYDRIKDLSTI